MKSIEIITPQNIIIEYQLASVMDRFLAFLIDMCLLLAYAFITLLFIQALAYSSNIETYAAIFISPVYFFYNLVCEIFFGGQSIGKKALSIKVVRLNGQNPIIAECFLRWVFRLVDILSTLGALAALFVSSGEKSQRLGDIVAGTVVIKLNPVSRYTIADIMNIKSGDAQSEFKYPQVVSLNDEDMLLIKNALERNRLYPNESHKRFINELTGKVCVELNITEKINDQPAFLKSLLQEYIMLTR